MNLIDRIIAKMNCSAANLAETANLFVKMAELQFPEESSWVPQRLREHDSFKSFPTSSPEKIFQSFGLNDFRMPIEESISDIDNVYKLCIEIANVLTNAKLKLLSTSKLIEVDDELVHSNEVTALSNVIKILISVISDDAFVKQKKLSLTQDIISNNKSIKYNKGASLFKVYADLGRRFASLGVEIPNIESFKEFKDFSKKINKLTLVFSTKINDLVGISSRGIRSCQSLFDITDKIPNLTDFNKGLVGVILSKYIGVCYITPGSDFMGRGEKMLYRSLVRQVFDKKDDKPYIVLDKLYPSANTTISQIMKTALQQKSSAPVLSLELDQGSDNFYNPEEHEIFLDQETRSYIDSKFGKNINKLLEQTKSADPNVKFDAIKRLPSEYLDAFSHDENVEVRLFVARKGLEKTLLKMIHDPDEHVRKVIVEEFEPTMLRHMINDPSDMVREKVSKRIKPLLLHEMINDPNLNVRYNVATRFSNLGNEYYDYLKEMLNDSSRVIRNIAADALEVPRREEDQD